MQRTGIAAAIGAIVSSLATLACCLPAGFLGAAGGTALLAFLFQAGQPWLLALSFAFLAVGFVQVVRVKRCGRKPNWVVVTLLAAALVIVVLAALFPQLIAGWLADLAGTG